VKDEYDLVKAVRCSQKKSFISHRIIQRNKFFPRVDRGSIRLAWHEKDSRKPDPDKVPNTRFHVIADEKFRFDIGIGTGCDDPDSDEEDGNGLEQDNEAHPGNEEAAGSNSFVDAEMRLERRSFRQGSVT
jgi:hypothetical protein